MVNLNILTNKINYNFININGYTIICTNRINTTSHVTNYVINIDNIFNTLENMYLPFDFSNTAGGSNPNKKEITTYIKNILKDARYSIYDFVGVRDLTHYSPTLFYQIKSDISNNAAIMEEYSELNKAIKEYSQDSSIDIDLYDLPGYPSYKFDHDFRKELKYILIPTGKDYSNFLKIPRYYILTSVYDDNKNPHVKMFLSSNTNTIDIFQDTKNIKLLTEVNPTGSSILSSIAPYIQENTRFNITCINKSHFDYTLQQNISSALHKRANFPTCMLGFNKVALVDAIKRIHGTIIANPGTIASSTAYHRILNTLGGKYKINNFTGLTSNKKASSITARMSDLYDECENEIVSNLQSIGITAKDISDSNKFDSEYYDLLSEARRLNSEMEFVTPSLKGQRKDLLDNYTISPADFLSSYSIFDKVLLSMPLSNIKTVDKDSAYAEFARKILTLQMYYSFIIKNAEMQHKARTIGSYTEYSYMLKPISIISHETLIFCSYLFNLPNKVVDNIISKHVTIDMCNSFMFETVEKKKKSINTNTKKNKELDIEKINLSTVKDTEESIKINNLDAHLVTHFLSELNKIDKF